MKFLAVLLAIGVLMGASSAKVEDLIVDAGVDCVGDYNPDYGSYESVDDSYE